MESDELTVAAGRPRGRLKVYLGATPGCGKTFAMLREGLDRRDQGEDVVVGFVESHGRPRTTESIGTLEIVPRIAIDYRGTTLSEMDVDAVIARRPHIALVDELAHTNAPGIRHAKRWQDVDDLLGAGIDVITTMNVQHLESIKDLVEQIAGIPIHETVPDTVLDGADEIQFIDITPEALRKRMRHGNIYPQDRVETALHNFFRPGNLAALREIGLRYVAGRVDSNRGSIVAPPKNVLVSVSGRRSAEPLIRRAVRIARRERGVCTVFHVHEHQVDPEANDDIWRRLATTLGCTIIEREGGNIAESLIQAARESHVQHVVVGDPKVGGTLALLKPTVVDRVLKELPDVDVHIIARDGRRHVTDSVRDRPDADALLQEIAEAPSGYGGLRIYLGYARGCGTTTAMLDEARRRAARGTDVVVAALGSDSVEIGELQLLGGPRSVAARGILDLDALLSRNPDVAAVDDLSGSTVDGRSVSEVLPQLRTAGIAVIATAHLASLRGVAATMGSRLNTAVDTRLLKDAVLDTADELELVDVVPGDLIERLRGGEIMPLTDAARALQADFRMDVLTVLREMAFRYVAHHTDRRLMRYMSTARITDAWETRPRVLVCVPPRPGQEPLIRTAVRLAAIRDEDLTALSVRREQMSEETQRELGTYAALTHQLGGEFVTVYGSDVAGALAEYAEANRITEIVMARSARRGQHSRTVNRLIRQLSDVNVHVLALAD